MSRPAPQLSLLNGLIAFVQLCDPFRPLLFIVYVLAFWLNFSFRTKSSVCPYPPPTVVPPPGSGQGAAMRASVHQFPFLIIAYIHLTSHQYTFVCSPGCSNDPNLQPGQHQHEPFPNGPQTEPQPPSEPPVPARDQLRNRWPLFRCSSTVAWGLLTLQTIRLLALRLLHNPTESMTQMPVSCSTRVY